MRIASWTLAISLAALGCGRGPREVARVQSDSPGATGATTAGGTSASDASSTSGSSGGGISTTASADISHGPCEGQWCPDMPSLTWRNLHAIWGSSPSDVWIGGDDGMLLHWSGAQWSSTLVAVPSGTAWNALWGSASDDIWAAGGSSLAHWDGKRWNATSFGSQSLVALWGSAPDDVWVAGAAGTLGHFDGARWTAWTSPTTSDFAALWGSSARDVYAAAGTQLFHFDGQTWSAAFNGSARLRSISGTGPSDVWVTGGDFGFFEDHFDGVRWSAATDSLGGNARPLIFDRGAQSVFAVTDGEVAMGMTPYHVAGTVQWDGSQWSWVQPLWGQPTEAMWSSGNDVWAVGGFGEVARFDGTAWTELSTEAHAGWREDLGVGSLCASGDEVWGIGVPPYPEQNDYVLLRRTAQGWVVDSSFTATPDAIASAGGGDVWALMDRRVSYAQSALYRGHAGAWSKVDVPPAPDGGASLAVLAASPDGMPWLGGSDGYRSQPDGTYAPSQSFVWRLSNAGWSLFTLPDSTGVAGLGVNSASDAVAVTRDGAIFQFDGASWNRIAAPHSTTGYESYQVWIGGPSDVWVLTVRDSQVQHFDGRTWQVMPLGTAAGLALWAFGPDDLWVATDSGLEHWDGSRFTPVTTPFAGVNSITGANGRLWISWGGAILERQL